VPSRKNREMIRRTQKKASGAAEEKGLPRERKDSSVKYLPKKKKKLGIRKIDNIVSTELPSFRKNGVPLGTLKKKDNL